MSSLLLWVLLTLRGGPLILQQFLLSPHCNHCARATETRVTPVEEGVESLWGVPRRGQGWWCGITEKAHTCLEGLRLGGRTVRPEGGSQDQEGGAFMGK